MTENYQLTLALKAEPMTVYRAITEESQVRLWWTPTCTMTRAVGGLCRFEFAKSYKVMMIETLTPGKAITWRCTEAFIDAPTVLTKPNEWAGTRVKFRLAPIGDNFCELDFQHSGLTKMLQCWDLCEAGWNHFLGASLKSYIETGKGLPWSPSSPAATP